MFLLDWYKEYLELKYERAAREKELEFCQACDTLKLQLAVANEERKFLIEKLTADKQINEDKVIDTTQLRPVLPSRMNWNVRRQMLESESRAEAKIIAERNKQTNSNGVSNKPLTVNEIEKELGVNQ